MATEAKWSDFASLDAGRTATAASRLLPPWVSLVLVVVIGWQLAKIVWMLVPGPAAGDPVVIPAGQALTARDGPAGADAQAIADAHIFGEADADDAGPGPGPVIPDDVPESASSLQLRGTIASEKPELSAAIISDGGRDEKVYLIGDPIISGAKLHAVLRDHVVLNENGNLTKLSLPQDFPQSAAPAAVRRSSPLRPTQADTQSIQAVVSQNVARLADVIRPTPYFVNGQQEGYRVYPGRDRRQFAALGLRPGDLIKDINGQSLTDPTQAMEIFQSLGNSSEVSVTVERDGQPEVIILNTDQLELGDEETE